MAQETQLLEPGSDSRKRKFVQNHRHKDSIKKLKGKPAQHGQKNSSKKLKGTPALHGHGQKKVKINKEMKKLYHKRAREYNSDGDDEEDETTVRATTRTRRMPSIKDEKNEVDDMENEDLSDGEGAAGGEKEKHKNVTDRNNRNSEDEEDDGEIQPGITKFTEGCKAFKLAFMSIIKKSVSDDLLSPILSANKNLVVEKLAEEVAERKNKREARKEKQMLAEKGHVKPATYLDAHEKFLISVATKGVVKLFNAVNKAQAAQKGLNSSRTRDAKEIRKRTKEAFFSELGKASVPKIGTSGKANASTSNAEDEQPAWAPLRDNYMLTSSKLKDWDKMPNKNVSDDTGKIYEDSSDED